MKIIVKKFGGTSLSDIGKINRAISYIRNALVKNYYVVVVVSAMGKETDRLLSLYEKLDEYNFDDGDYFFVQWPWCQWMTAKKLYNRWDDVYLIYLKRDFEKQHDSRSRDFEINSWSDNDGEWDVPKFKEMKEKVIEQWKKFKIYQVLQ